MSYARHIAIICIGTFSLPASAQGVGNERISDVDLSSLMTGWEKEVKARIQKDEKLKALASKNTFSLLHRRMAGAGYRQSAYSFVHESAIDAVHRNEVQIVFAGDSRRSWFTSSGNNSLLVKLTPRDFEKGVDPRQISIDHPGIITESEDVIEGTVYLLRARDFDGNDFFVVFQVIALDLHGRYMSFLWRHLPGGKPIVRKKVLLPES